MTHFAAIAAAATTSDTALLSFPFRANEGGWEKLFELGARLTPAGNVAFGKGAFQVCECEVPSGWNIRKTTISPNQDIVFDAEGHVVARIYTKPQGGGSIHVILNGDDPLAAYSDADITPIPTSQPATVNSWTATEHRRTFQLPRRSNEGGIEHLESLGVRATGNGAVQTFQVELPLGWRVSDTDISPMQMRIYDEEGNLVVKLFYKLHGGAPQMEVLF